MSSSFNLQNLTTSSSSSGLSFAGVATGINTNSIVQAEVTQASQPMVAMQTQVSNDNARSTALGTLSSNMTALSSAITTMNTSGFQSRIVTSSDTSNTYVTATAQGGTPGNYDVQVATVATDARLTPTTDASGNATNLAVASASAPIFTGSSASFAVVGTDGVAQQITLNSSNNNIYGLADAINAAQTPDTAAGQTVGLGVTATVVNTGSGTNPYELVLNSNQTGVGAGGANLAIADTTTGGAVNTLGIAAGTYSAGTVTGGTQSNQAASNAQFTLDGIKLTRTSNTVTDAVNGVTFNLLQGGQTGNTTLTVAQDTSTATGDMNNVISAYNTMVQSYNAANVSGGAFYEDSTAQGLLNQVTSALTGIPQGLASTATLNSAASLGISTNEDGTLSLDTTAFQTALSQNPAAALNVFASNGTSSNPAVTFDQSGPNTVTGSLGFNITSYTAGGPLSGTITTPDGTQYAVSGNNGVLAGAAGTELAGLYLNVNGTGSGTLNLSYGVGQAAVDAITGLTAYGTGGIASVQKDISTDITGLNTQIASQQSMLNTLQNSLQAEYSQMESTVASLQAAGQSIGTI